MKSAIDWCSASPEYIGKVYLGRPCCKRHDKLYTKPSFFEKLGSDAMLMGCVMVQGVLGVGKGLLWVGSGLLCIPYGVLMYIAVSTLGWYWWLKARKGDNDG